MADSPGLFSWIPPVAPPGIGTQTVSDDFTRANQNPISGNWTSGIINPYQLFSNAVIETNFASTEDVCIYSAWASGNDQYSQAAITAVGSGAGNGLGVCVRHSATVGTVTMYRLVIDASGNIELAKFVTGSFGFLASATVSYVAGKKLGLSVSGSGTTTLKIWYDAVQIGANVTDSSSPLTTGVPGLAYSFSITSGTWDNWDGGTVP